MTNIAPPSMNPTNSGSLSGVMGFVLQKFLQGIDDMLPAQIVSYNRNSNVAQVQPLIPMVTTNNISIKRAALQRVPVQIDGGGNFLVSFPCKAGDLGWIKANDRDISLFLQSYQSAVPNTARKHSFEDGVFIPAQMHGYTIDGSDADNLVIQSLDGSVKISLGEADITIEAPAVNIISNGGVTTVTGDFHTSGDVVIAGKSFLSHIHGGVATGSGDTGVPV